MSNRTVTDKVTALQIVALSMLMLPGFASTAVAQVRVPDGVVDLFARSWNAHSMKAFCDVLAEDADWVTVAGTRLKGRSEVQAFLDKEHSGWARTTSMRATDVAMRSLGVDAAVVSFNWEITRPVGRDGQPSAPSRGVNLFVVARQGSGWKVVSGQVGVEPRSATRDADREQINTILQGVEDAWNKHDMRALANLFHEDGVWILWTGDVWTGRKAIEEGHAAVHRTVFRNSVQREQLEELTFVGPDAAVLRYCSTLTGDERAPEKLIRSRKIMVMTKRDGGWKIGWGQNTRFADSVPDAPACSKPRQ
jgi:uncharacterized protein (TIGR02246 family)